MYASFSFKHCPGEATRPYCSPEDIPCTSIPNPFQKTPSYTSEIIVIRSVDIDVSLNLTIKSYSLEIIL